MKKGLLLILLLLTVGSSVFACGGITMPAYSGQIRYFFAPKENGVIEKAITCNVVVTLYFDVKDSLPTDSIFVNWGDGRTSIVFATKIEQDTGKAIGFAGVKTFYQHIYEGQHTYDSVPAIGYCTISIDSQFRQPSTSNISQGANNNTPFYIETRAVPDTSAGFVNTSPFMAPPFMKYGSAKSPLHINPLVTDVDGDSLVFEIVTPLQSQTRQVPLYSYLDQFCNNFPNQNSTCTINPETGELTWQTPCYQGIFSLAVMVSEYRDGKLLGSIIREENLMIGSKVITDIPIYIEEPTLNLYPNPAENRLSGNITALSSSSASIEIISMDGRVVLIDQTDKAGYYNIDVSPLSGGLYLIRISNNGHAMLGRFVKS